MTRGLAVEVGPDVAFGRPALRGIPTELLAGLYWAHGEAEVHGNYELTRHELLVALWFEATYGQPRFRRRWREWAQGVAGALWTSSKLDPDAVGLPSVR